MQIFFRLPHYSTDGNQRLYGAALPKKGGTYLQAESEIAAVNMVLGAASTGVRAMTSSSSPGISLKTEGISYLAASDLPCRL
jgi:2-oxoglutarate ferredoxin oxidoreductase subunit alpha